MGQSVSHDSHPQEYPETGEDFERRRDENLLLQIRSSKSLGLKIIMKKLQE